MGSLELWLYCARMALKLTAETSSFVSRLTKGGGVAGVVGIRLA